MNKDLKDYINTFDKFDEQALFDIGMMLRALPLRDRKWEELYAYLDVKGLDTENKFKGSSENYRKWVSRMCSEGWTVSTDVPLVAVSESEQAIKRDAFVKRVLAADANANYVKLVRDTARLDEFKELLVEAIGKLPELPQIKFTGKANKTTAEAVVLLSDLHIGAECDNYCNKFNVDIAKERLAKYADEIIRQCKLHNVKTLNLLQLGDMVHGLIHTSVRLNSRVDVSQQVSIAAELIAEFANKLQEAAPNVVYRSCTDNHGRMTPKKDEAVEKESFNKLVDELVELRLTQKNCKVKFPKDNIGPAIGSFKLANGETCFFEHGHQIKNDQAIQSLFGLVPGVVPKYVFLGHVHNVKVKSFQNSKVFVNGSVIGVDDYAFDSHLFNDPEQSMFIFEGNTIQETIVNLK